ARRRGGRQCLRLGRVGGLDGCGDALAESVLRSAVTAALPVRAVLLVERGRVGCLLRLAGRERVLNRRRGRLRLLRDALPERIGLAGVRAVRGGEARPHLRAQLRTELAGDGRRRRGGVGEGSDRNEQRGYRNHQQDGLHFGDTSNVGNGLFVLSSPL